MPTISKQKVTTFLMFEGKAEQAVSLYISLFKESGLVSIKRYGPDGPGALGTVEKACFSLNGQEFIAIDSPIKHAFGFTPAISLFVQCDSDREVDHLYHRLSEGGKVLMPLDKYPFNERYCWITDRYGVSWQIGKPAHSENLTNG